MSVNKNPIGDYSESPSWHSALCSLPVCAAAKPDPEHCLAVRRGPLAGMFLALLLCVATVTGQSGLQTLLSLLQTFPHTGQLARADRSGQEMMV